MTSLIVYSLKKKRANNVCLLVPAIPNEGKWSDVEDFLHILTADYDFECFQQSPPSQITTNWILFQFIFLNVTVKDDFASLIVIYPNLQTNRNYVVDLLESFLGHTVYI
ncbi:18911_t:CDS:2, partial [Rhizophagus irregularis]